MDVEAFVTVQRRTWDRLAHLVRQQRKLTGAEADELVTLYQRVGTHLSALRAAGADPVTIGRLSGLLADARGAVTGAQTPVWRDISRYFLVSFPAALYASRRWWLAIGAVFYLIAGWLAYRIVAHPEVLSSIATPGQIQQIVDEDFANYYSENPAQDFALRVWTNNALISAAVLALGVLIIPACFMLWSNATNLGVMAGIMIGHGKSDVFFGLITPHGLLELTAVFVAAAAGLRLGLGLGRPGSADPDPGAGPDRPGHDGDGDRDRGGAAAQRADRGVRDTVTAAHSGPGRDRDRGRGRVPRVCLDPRPPRVQGR